MIVTNCDSNGLKTEKDHGKIADNILGLAHQCKNDNHTMMISEIVPWNDDLNDDVIIVNKTLREARSKRNNGFIDNENINPICNCNQSKLHFNKRETNLLVGKILFSLFDDISDWHKGTVSKFSCKFKPKWNENLSLSDNSIFPILTTLLR